MCTRKQKGFSLVELMVVVAVIGVISSFAMPIYMQYLKRSKVSEALLLLGATKQPAMEFYYYHNRWPTSIASISSKDSGRYTSRVTTGATSSQPDSLFFVEASMNNEDADLAGRQIRMYYERDKKEWSCSISNVGDGDDGGVPLQVMYVPAVCR